MWFHHVRICIKKRSPLTEEGLIMNVYPVQQLIFAFALPNGIIRSSGGGYFGRYALMTACCSLAKIVRLMTFPTRSWTILSWTTGMVLSTAMFQRYATQILNTKPLTVHCISLSNVTQSCPLNVRWRALTGSASWLFSVRACCRMAFLRGTPWPSPGTWCTTAACTSPSTSSGNVMPSLQGTLWRSVFLQLVVI